MKDEPKDKIKDTFEQFNEKIQQNLNECEQKL
jgi:hypothetical protein